jgi:hypothetical protein
MLLVHTFGRLGEVWLAGWVCDASAGDDDYRIVVF